MSIPIDKAYHTEKLLDWEVDSLTEKYTTKWPGILTVVLLVVAFAIIGLILPFTPPRHPGSWRPPSSLEEYCQRLKSLYLFAIASFVVVCPSIYFRNRLDLYWGIKRVANFKVLDVIDLERNKILVLSTGRLFRIRKGSSHFNTVTKGQIISIKRTGTFKRIDYYIRDEV